MTTETLSYRDMIGRLPPESLLVLRSVSWEEYEDLLDAFGRDKGKRFSYNEGRLEVMVLSSEHEHYAELIKQIVGLLSLRLHTEVLHFGSTTMKKKGQAKGAEPDACFYVQASPSIGNRKQIDFDRDPPPDLLVEVDLHHESLSKFPIYAEFGIKEIWRYDGGSVSIHVLNEEQYVLASASLAFPILTGDHLTQLLNRSQTENQYAILLAFEEWLRERK